MQDWVTFDGVYEPREDSYLLLSALQDEELDGKRVCDMGTGTGILAAAAARQGAEVTAVDVNPDALDNARHNLERAGTGSVELVRSDLFADVNDVFDLITCNPPYVPGEPELETVEERAWTGGEKGRAVIDRFVDAVPHHLTETGVVLLLQSSKNGIDETMQRFQGKRMDARLVAEEKIPWERLVIIRAVKTDG